MVYLPLVTIHPADSTGEVHVRFHIEAGATLFATMDSSAYQKSHWAALIYGQDLENISLEGRGTLDGQSEYQWRLDDIDDAYIERIVC